MKQVLVILWAKLRVARHVIASARNESKLKIAVVSVSAVGLWVGALGFFLEGFGWLMKFGIDTGDRMFGVGDIIMIRMLAVLSLAVFFMLIFSNVLVAFSTLYRSREVAYLIQGPVSFRALFITRFAECVVFSSWALAFLGSPLILAYGIVAGAPLIFYVAAVVFYLPYIVLPAAIGSLITLVLTRVFPQLKIRVMILLGVLAVCLFFIYLKNILNAARLSEDTFLLALFDAASQTQSSFLPSFWASRGILATMEGRSRECGFYLLLLLSNALLMTWVATETAQRVFYPGWSYLMGQDRTRRRPLDRGILGRLDGLLGGLRNPARALIVKDIKLFWRDATQWSQFVIFFGIMAVYIANIRNAAGNLHTAFWRNWVACLNIGACTLILATLTSRFVFPLVSLEGRRFWVIGLAPVTVRQLVRQKFWLSVATTSFFTVGLAVLSGVMLRVEPIHFFLSVYSVLIMNFGLAGLAVGLGALYPNFQEDNPARIVSGMGGTLNFLLSIGYITWVIGLQTAVLQGRVLNLFPNPQSFRWALAAVLVFITGLSVVSAWLPMRLGLRNLTDMEF